MASSNEGNGAAQKLLIFGDNPTSVSIVKELSHGLPRLDVHFTTSTPKQSTAVDSFAKSHWTDLSATAIQDVLSSIRPDIVISTVAGGSYDTQKRIIDCAIACGAQRFVPCEFGQDTLNHKIQSRLPQTTEKARVIRYLEEVASQKKLTWIGLSVGTILDRSLVTGSLGFDLKWFSATLYGGGNEWFAASSIAWVGKVTRAAIEHWNELSSQYLYVAGLTTTCNEIVSALTRMTGQEWTIGSAEVDECLREAERRIDRGFPDAGMFLMERSVLFDKTLEAIVPFVEKDAKRGLGLRGEVLEDVVHNALHEHQHLGGKADCGCG